MDTNALFLLATKQKFRFTSGQGLLSTEQIWQLPLTSKNGYDLDTVAKLANAELRALSEESFVAVTSPGKATAEAKLEVIKAIIADKQAEAAKQAKQVERSQEKHRLLAILASKEDDELRGSSKEEILKRLEALQD